MPFVWLFGARLLLSQLRNYEINPTNDENMKDFITNARAHFEEASSAIGSHRVHAHSLWRYVYNNVNLIYYMQVKNQRKITRILMGMKYV